MSPETKRNQKISIMAKEIIFQAPDSPGSITVRKVKYTDLFLQSHPLLIFDKDYGYVKGYARAYKKMHDDHILPAEADENGFVYIGEIDGSTAFLQNVVAVAILPKSAPQLSK